MTEKDQWGQESDITAEDMQIWGDYREWGRSAVGQRILAHLEEHLHAEETITPEEIRGDPIDPTAYLVRSGMRRAFRFIKTQIDALDRIEARRLREERG